MRYPRAGSTSPSTTTSNRNECPCSRRHLWSGGKVGRSWAASKWKLLLNRTRIGWVTGSLLLVTRGAVDREGLAARPHCMPGTATSEEQRIPEALLRAAGVAVERDVQARAVA